MTEIININEFKNNHEYMKTNLEDPKNNKAKRNNLLLIYKQQSESRELIHQN